MELNNNQIIFETFVGSKLYGTNTKNSDTDIKGVFVPTKRQLLLSEFPDTITINTNKKTKNSENDVDKEYYSIQYFFKLLKKGETNAMDLLHAYSSNMIIKTTPIFDMIYKKRKMFYSKNMNAFVGYSKIQFNKFIIKRDKLKNLEMLLEILVHDLSGGIKEYTKLIDIIDKLPQNENLKKEHDFYVVFDKKFQYTISIDYFYNCIYKLILQFGERTKKLRSQEYDWKSLYHAKRVLYELMEIYETGDLKFPLKSCEYLRKIKNGEIKFEEIETNYKKNIDHLNVLIKQSSLPDEVNEEKIDDFLFELMSVII